MRPRVKYEWQDAWSVIEPQINAESVHEWPFAPGFPIDVRFLVFGPQREIRMNRHEYFEVLYLFSGEVVYQVQEREYRLGTGDLFVMASTLLHRMGRYPRGRVKAAVLYFLPDLIRSGGSAAEEEQYLMPFLVQAPGFPHVVPAATGIPKQVFDLMKRARAELPARTTLARLCVTTYLKMMLVLLVNHYAVYRGSEQVFERRRKDLERLKPLFAFIDENYMNPLSVEQAASLLNMSRSSFMRFFKQVTGESFVSYLNRFRIAKAEALLRETALPVSEAAARCGFADQSYFGLLFRQYLHLTPREYRQRLEAARRASG